MREKQSVSNNSKDKLSRRKFIGAAAAAVTVACVILIYTPSNAASTDKPLKQALGADHFPDRVHTFIWRNWESVSLERMETAMNIQDKSSGNTSGQTPGSITTGPLPSSEAMPPASSDNGLPRNCLLR